MLSKVKFGYAMANIGMHLRPGDDSIRHIYTNAISAGLTDQDAFNLTAIAFCVKYNDLRRITKNAEHLRRNVIIRLATDNPYSVWAYALACHPHGIYTTDTEINYISMHDHAGWSAWAQSERAARELIESKTLAANPLDGG